MEWPLQDAKNRLSKLVKDARESGPQTITVRGKRTAVVLSAEDYDFLQSGTPTLVDHLLSGPPWPDELVELVNARDKSPGRDVEF